MGELCDCGHDKIHHSLEGYRGGIAEYVCAMCLKDSSGKTPNPYHDFETKEA
jgi:hypothetical protein